MIKGKLALFLARKFKIFDIYLEPFRPKLGLNRGWSLTGLFLMHPQSLKFPSQNSSRFQPLPILIISFHLCQLIFGILTVFPDFKFGAQFLGSLRISDCSQFLVLFVLGVTGGWRASITGSVTLLFQFLKLNFKGELTYKRILNNHHQNTRFRIQFLSRRPICGVEWIF